MLTLNKRSNISK